MSRLDSETVRSPSAAGTFRRWGGPLFYLLIGVLLVFYLRRLDFSALARIHLTWVYLVAAVAAGLFHRLLVPGVWVLLLRSLGVAVRNYPAYNFVYAKAWLGRYVPGKVAMVAARIYFAETLGAGRSVIAVTSIAEIGAQLWVGGAIGLLGIASLAGSVEALASYRALAFGFVALLAVGLFPPVFNRVMKSVFRLFRRSVDGHPYVRTQTLAVAVAGLTVASLGTAGMAIFVAGSVARVAFEHMLFVWGSYSLAGALGMAFVFSPSGLGAREAVLLTLFTLVFSREQALAIVALSRVVELVIDAVFYSVSAVWDWVWRTWLARATS